MRIAKVQVKTGIAMTRKTRPIAVVALCIGVSSPALAAKLPAIKATGENQVPACATPGRLGEYLKSRNSGLDPRFETIATEYMRHGEEYSIRWDYAFFQMIVETGNLSFKRGNGRWGDVKPGQNNFAGLGATGGGEPGESFKDITTGVRAHIEHVVMYSGEHLASPTAERTRKVQEWGVLTSWHKSHKSPITFTDLTRKWSPGDGSYSASIQSVADRFYEDFCNKPDPRPELVAEARKGRPGSETKVAAKEADKGERVSGAEIARRNIEEARAEGRARDSLGAGALAKAADAARTQPAEPNRSPAQPTVTVLNPPKGEEPAAAAPAAKAPAAKEKSATVQMASAAQAGKGAAGPAKCNVYTASYGGQKAVIIKAPSAEAVNYTVLDVNDGAEKRETDAYIAAYAKGGQAIGEFGSQEQALDKAFELCPEN